MKKLILAITAFSMIAFTSCKSEEDKSVDAMGVTLDENESEAEELFDEELNLIDAAKVANEIPEFSNDEVQRFAEEYAAYFNEIMENNDHPEKLNELMSQGVEWSKRTLEVMKKMTPEDKEKWTEWAAKLQSVAAGE